MSKKLPLEIQRNYSINDKGTEWHLSCLVCDKAWKLQKPGKGEKIHGGNILHLLDHAASHPLAEEAEEEPVVELVEESPTTDPSPTESQPELPPTSQVKVHPKKTFGPHDYVVEWYGSPALCHMVKVSHFKQPDFTLYDYVQRVTDTHFKVVLKAANQKHAQLVGERMIQKFFKNQQKEKIV
jgi:hypothetical protein